LRSREFGAEDHGVHDAAATNDYLRAVRERLYLVKRAALERVGKSPVVGDPAAFGKNQFARMHGDKLASVVVSHSADEVVFADLVGLGGVGRQRGERGRVGEKSGELFRLSDGKTVDLDAHGMKSWASRSSRMARLNMFIDPFLLIGVDYLLQSPHFEIMTLRRITQIDQFLPSLFQLRHHARRLRIEVCHQERSEHVRVFESPHLFCEAFKRIVLWLFVHGSFPFQAGVERGDTGAGDLQ